MADCGPRPGQPVRRVMVAAVLSGILAALGQAPMSLPWATLAGLAIAFTLFCRTSRPRVAAWMGCAFGAGYFAVTLFWIVEPFLVDPLRHGWMAPFALVLTSVGFALFWGAAWWLARWLVFKDWTAALAWPCAIALSELARSYVLTGFPWALIGHVWIDWAPMQLAAWTGPHGLTFLTLLAAALPMMAARWRRSAALLAALPFAGLYAAGTWMANQPVLETGQPRPVLRLVQPNAPQHLKWHRDHAHVFFERMLDQSAAASARRPDLIVWPETAVPTMLDQAGPVIGRIADAADGVPVVLGIQRRDGRRVHNSLVLLDGSGAVAEVYDKHHLVPFGEYVPLGDLMARFGLTMYSARHGFGYSPGPGARLIDMGRLGKVLPLICYEAIFPQDVAAAPERPAWLLQITNDAWFGQISGPYQHLAQARLRAVEQGLPMVRVANTGVSAVINAHGVTEAQLPLGKDGYLDVYLPPSLPPTLYSRTGDWAASCTLLLLFAALFALRMVSSRNGNAVRAA